MNPPESAAQGSEARNLNAVTPQPPPALGADHALASEGGQATHPFRLCSWKQHGQVMKPNGVAFVALSQGIGASYFPETDRTVRPSTGCRGFYPGHFFTSYIGESVK